ncbi:MAG: class I SAM-dependent methyltransferase [Candidatus Gracilibacteria bacterium]|nr:class I SAM-dependent methyltransferase [Candidatus Gracilibacteria bacterium]
MSSPNSSEREKYLYNLDLKNASNNPYLDYEALKKVMFKIFQGKKTISYERQKELTKLSYSPIDMETYAKLHNFSDTLMVTEYFAYTRTKIQNITNRTDRILVVGCGQGRLAEVYLTLAAIYNVKEVVFLDLIKEHVEQTEEKIRLAKEANPRLRNVKTELIVGDINETEINSVFDSIWLIWFVSSEFCNAESPEALISTRNRIYQKFNKLLTPQGALIEDIPDPNMEPGFYHLGNLISEDILRRNGILPGQQKNLLLSNWSPEQPEKDNVSFPYQLRFTARNGWDVQEKERAGFAMKKNDQLKIPISSTYAIDTALSMIRESSPTNMGQILRDLKSLANNTIQYPEIDVVDQKRRKITWWEKTN